MAKKTILFCKRIKFYLKCLLVKILPNFDPSQRMIGIMMIRNENDMLRETLTNLTKVYDRIFVLDGTMPEEEFLKGKKIMEEFQEVKFILRDADTAGPFPIRDGARKYLMEEVRKRYGVNNWVGILHGDEMYSKDPRPLLKEINPYRTPVVMIRLCHFFLHSNDGPKWEVLKEKPVEERVTHYMWPGTPEDRFFYDFGKTNYEPSRHSLVVPYPQVYVSRKMINDFIIKQYNYRTPEQMAERASQRIKSSWQSNHYQHIYKEGLCFTDSLHIPGYEPCGYDNKIIKDESKWSKPRSIKSHPLGFLESNIVPIFIGGVGRTGSTYLKQLLGMHPKLSALNWESKFISWEYGLMDLLHNFKKENLNLFLEHMQEGNECSYPEYKCKQIYNWRFRAFNGSEEDLEFYEIELERISRVLSDTSLPIENKMKLVAEFVHFLFDRVAISTDAIGWVEQTPLNIDWASQLLRSFENSIFIYIYRDPRDVIASLIPLWWGPNTVEEGIKYYKHNQKRWKASQRMIIEQDLEDRLFVIKFEELIKSRGKNLQPIFEMLGIQPIDLSITDKKANIGRWKKQFNHEERKMLNESLKDELLEQGYF